jgi:hypothetical protein
MAISEEQLKRLAEQLPDVSRDPQAVRNRVEAMEKLLERVFVIPSYTNTLHSGSKCSFDTRFSIFEHQTIVRKNFYQLRCPKENFRIRFGTYNHCSIHNNFKHVFYL